MLLVIDVGNSHVVLGVFDETGLRCHWRLKTDKDATADELAVLLQALFAMRGLAPSRLSGAIIACVVPPAQAAWEEVTRKHLGLSPLLVRRGDLDFGMEVRTDNPSEVGADRIVNAVAAYKAYPGPLIVVDFGTATTFDCVSADGAYLGGAIAPGIAISLDALFHKAAKLPRVDISTPPAGPIGTNTVAAVRSGVLFGYGGLVDGLVGRIREEIRPDVPTVVATGGMAELVAPYAPSIEKVIPLLTLEGLRILYARNK